MIRSETVVPDRVARQRNKSELNGRLAAENKTEQIQAH